VTLVARRPEPLNEAAQRLSRQRPGAAVRTLALDVADQASVSDMLPRELAAQPVDLVVNNAGVAHAGRLMETEPERLRTLLDINVLGTIWVTRAVVPHLRARGHGHIVNVASRAVLEGIYGYSAYATSKFAVLGFSQVLRAELKPDGIGVSILLPPNTDTPSWQLSSSSCRPRCARFTRSAR